MFRAVQAFECIIIHYSGNKTPETTTYNNQNKNKEKQKRTNKNNIQPEEEHEENNYKYTLYNKCSVHETNTATTNINQPTN